MLGHSTLIFCFGLPTVPAPQTLPEKEAKTIVAQILSGLVYLNTKPRRWAVLGSGGTFESARNAMTCAWQHGCLLLLAVDPESSLMCYVAIWPLQVHYLC